MDNAILETILQRVRPLIGQGKVADYIPALASVEGSKLGIAICTVDGQHYQAGDAHERFSIQSISKVLSLVVAMRHYPEEEIWQRVGKDPSGSPFNSLVQLEMEQGIPRNPFINAGALVVCDMLQGRLSAPRQRMLEVVRALCGVSDITYDATVARSEFEHSARNAAIAWLMKSFGNFHHDVPTVLQNYFHYCALKMSCMELARTFVFLANQGEAFHLDEPVVTPMQARQINALMATSGMYQNAGEFAWRVGLPAKSGVGGGIVAIVPHEMAIAVWSPELDPAGNSLAGIAATNVRTFGILMNALEPLFARLARSTFRSRFRLGIKERQYCWDKGAEVIDKHAADFIAQRLAPAHPANDGKQTPMRGHPVFIAQHATATCCRGCLAKWHQIPQGEPLSEAQQQYIVSVIHYWLVIQMNQR
ncbi:glutaminase [Salmonella enterica subsp. enterica serovar Cerro]|nr:glutaminase [Salmonella enterica subsp. enterica serovar Cerro]